MSTIHVLCCYSPQPRRVLELSLALASGATVQQALVMLQPEWQWPAGQIAAMGVWGRKVKASHVLQDGDRLELYRALRVDPKVARRQRFKRQGAKRSGLFATRRPGAVPGY
jgi:putative ubiquitin-RnfH superfamily antitoxin RatB of RatAB toxin-antitoxin module